MPHFVLIFDIQVRELYFGDVVKNVLKIGLLSDVYEPILSDLV